VPWSDDEDEASPEGLGALYVEPIPSFEAYEDLRDFVARVPDRRASDMLSRAIEGRGAFRRFKDTLFEFPELREAWFRFHDVRMRRRAIEWLVDHHVVEDAAGEAAMADLPDPPLGDGIVDPLAVARRVATELRPIFGDRLVDVVMFGSHATGTATDDSDLDLALILRGVGSPWDEARLADDVLWRATLDSGITVSALVVDVADWRDPGRPLLRAAKSQGQSAR
jgi:predicted nucleotidyltransferase